ncbi:hypothetical protein [Neotabrizicola sp. sgz301269]|uniref:hypothetical protein n=1 Tax=Neotabrizicola sp. sgz301269 TaxID=3276282 RepID=UPI00376FCBDB
MDDLVVVGRAQDGTRFYMSELSSQTLHENGLPGPPDGLYLYEECTDQTSPGIRVLAKVPDIGAAYRILEMMIGPWSATSALTSAG